MTFQNSINPVHWKYFCKDGGVDLKSACFVGSAFSIGVTLARKQRTFCKCLELLRECSSSLSGISCCPSLKKQFLCDFLIPFVPQLCLRLCSCFWLNPRSSKASSSSSFFFSSSSCLSSVCRLSSSSSCSPPPPDFPLKTIAQ